MNELPMLVFGKFVICLLGSGRSHPAVGVETCRMPTLPEYATANWRCRLKSGNPSHKNGRREAAIRGER